MHDPIQETIDLPTSPQQVYEALTNSQTFAAWSGAPATIGPNPGDAFTCFDGWIEARHVELIPNQRVVQAWRVKNWAPGVYSIVAFELSPTADGTLINFLQAGFPAEHRVHLVPGWHSKYWNPLKAHLALSRDS